MLRMGIAWLITNGWSYILLGIGAYLTFLWLPISPEKSVTFMIAIALLRFLFPKDEKTLAVLKNGSDKAKAVIKKKRKTPPTEKDSDE